MTQTKLIELTKLDVSDNIRQVTDDDDMADLVHSMQTRGQLSEIHVFPVGDGTYKVTFGHRRVVAAQKLGWTTIRAVVDKPVDDDELLLIRAAENEARKPMTYIEKALVYQHLKSMGWSQKDIADRLGVGTPEVSMALATLRAAPRLQEAVNNGEIAPSAIEPLLSQPVEVQVELAETAIRAKTVRKVLALVRTHKARRALQSAPVVSAVDDEEIDPLEELAVEGLEEALQRMRMVQQSGIQHPELVRRARPTVEELLRLANSLKQFLDGDGYDALSDLS